MKIFFFKKNFASRVVFLLYCPKGQLGKFWGITGRNQRFSKKKKNIQFLQFKYDKFIKYLMYNLKIRIYLLLAVSCVACGKKI